jgi:hypothetical protein
VKKNVALLIFLLLLVGGWVTAQQVRVAYVNRANTFTQSNTFTGGLTLTGSIVGNVLLSAPATSPGTIYTLPSLPGSAGYALCIGSTPGAIAYCPPPGIGGGVPTVNQSPASLSFGSVTVSTASAALPVLVGNTGTALLTFTGPPPFQFTGTNSADFSETSNCSATMDAGWACTVSVTFTPTGTGARTAALTINDSATNSPQVVNLSGTGM